MSERGDGMPTLATPWGDAARLRQRRLYPGAGTPPAEVKRNQCERLFAAAVAIAAEKGYEAMTVGDILELSGVSRSAFYAHFSDKADCLIAAAAEMVKPALDVLAPPGGNHAPRQVFDAFFELLEAQPAAARVCFIELHTIGARGEALGDQAFEVLFDAAEKMAVRPTEGGTPAELTRALLAGLRKLIHTRLSRGEGAGLTDLAPELWQWIESVPPPPGRLAVPRRQRPGTGARFEGYTPAERIARAVAKLVAENGYGRLSTDEIAAEASISLSTFYRHFTDKQDAAVGALEISGAQIMALAVPAARRAAGWQEGVRALYEVICTYFAAEPAMAQLATVGVYGAGSRALARRDRVIDSLAAMLGPGFEENPRAPRISAEAIAATVYALMREQIRREGPGTIGAVVPLATYITLTTFIGPDRALAVANSERAPQP